MALPPSFLDELRARTPLPALVGRRVKLTRSNRDWKGCCPFHNEKSPSFYVYADHYHCFGCGAHGDAIGFIMQTQNAGFMEAVEQLAGEAGLDVPRPTPEAAAAEKRRMDLNEILDAAARHYQKLLHEPEGRAALDYLRGRGLTDATISRFGLGYSGGGRGQLAAEFARGGIKQTELVEAGLMKKTDDGRFVDFFFNRVMFPIRDARGRMVSFGGRIIGDGQPKYLNGPETALFSKRRNLYGLDTARADLARQKPRAGEKRQGLLVVEGYMDVIALAQAGFPAVAPLGTAITQEQVEALWHYEQRPVFCFDGDAAGRRAGRRAIGLCLPLLTPEQSLGIVILPQGEDPDTIVTRRGARGMAEELARDTLETAIYSLTKDEVAPNSAESWAKFRDQLDEAANSIPHKAISSTFWSLFRGRWKGEVNQFVSAQRARPGFNGSNNGFPARRGGGRGRDLLPPVAIPPRKIHDQSEEQQAQRARTLIALLLTHPTLLPDLDEPLGMLDLPPYCARLRDALGAWLETDPPLDREALNAHLRRLGYEADLCAVLDAGQLAPSTIPGASPSEVVAFWWQIYGFMREAQLRDEVAAKQREFEQTQDAETHKQIVALIHALKRVQAGEMETG